MLTLGLFMSVHTLMMSQSGLEGIIVEKYYISTDKDTLAADSGGYLPPGSVTYRIYADLKPVYRLQAVYGVPEHELRIETTTRFYNCAMGDGRSANDIHPLNLSHNTLLLDSWVSVGAAALDYQGVMKSEDDTLENLVRKNAKGLLLNNAADMGIPLSVHDGMRHLRYQPATQFYNLDYDLRVFEYQYRDSSSGLFSTRDGAWASYGGSVGPHPENRVLIAQLTTDGILSFELNVQLAVPDGGSEKWVARNPAKDEFTLPSLMYRSTEDNLAPEVLLNTMQPATAKPGELVRFEAKASDKDGKITRVEFYVNDHLAATDVEAPFRFEQKAGEKPLKVAATAVDNKGAKTRSKDCFIVTEKFN